MAFLTTMANSYGARWFDENWKPQFDSPEWKAVLTDYVDILTKYGPPGASNNGYNENLTLSLQGKCGIRMDATVSAGALTDPKQSEFADKVGFTLAPDMGLGKRANWLWAWSLAIPSRRDAPDAAKTFVDWATNKDYLALVASKEGWANVPPGTRTSLYANPEYARLPFAKMTIDSINAADPTHPTVKPVPYTGVQFVAIPEFAGIGTSVGEIFSAALAGQKSVDDALAEAQTFVTDEMTVGRLHQVTSPTSKSMETGPNVGPVPPFGARKNCAPTLLSVRCRPTHTFKPFEGERPHVHAKHPRRGPPDGGAFGHPALHLDDRAAGDDDLLLVPALPAAVAGPDRLGGFQQLCLVPELARLLGRHRQHAPAGGRRAGHHGRPGHPDRHPDRPADLGPGAAADSGDLALLRDAAGGRVDLGKPVHASAERTVGGGGAGVGTEPILFLESYPMASVIFIVVLGMAALRHADPADRAAIHVIRAAGGRRDGRGVIPVAVPLSGAAAPVAARSPS